MECKQLQQLHGGPRYLRCPREPCKGPIWSGTGLGRGDTGLDWAVRTGSKARSARPRQIGHHSPSAAPYSQSLTLVALEHEDLSSLSKLFHIPTTSLLGPSHASSLTQRASPNPVVQHHTFRTQQCIARGTLSSTLSWHQGHLGRPLHCSANLSDSRPRLASSPRDGAPAPPGKPSLALRIRRQHGSTSFLPPTHCPSLHKGRDRRGRVGSCHAATPSATLGRSQEDGHEVHPHHRHRPSPGQEEAGPGPGSAHEDTAQLESSARASGQGVGAATAVAEKLQESQSPILTRGLYDRVAQLSPAPPWDVLLAEAGAIEAQRCAASAHEDLARVLELLGVTDAEHRMQGRVTKSLVHRWMEEGITPRLRLFQSYGFATASLQRAFRNYPHLLGKSTQALRASMDFSLELGFSKEKLCSDNTTWGFLGLNLEGRIRPKVLLLEGLVGQGVGELVERCPRLLLVSRASLARNADALRAIVGRDRFPALLQRNPRVLTFQALRVRFIHSLVQAQCAFSELQWELIFGRMCALPANEALIGSRMQALIAAVGEDSVAGAVLRDPTILSVSPGIIEYNMARLREIMPEAEARALVLSKTQLLTLDWERRIQPALAYLQAACGISRDDALRSHAYTRSLEGVLKPRVTTLLGMGIEVRARRADGKGRGRARGPAKGLVKGLAKGEGEAEGEGEGEGEAEGEEGSDAKSTRDNLVIHLSTMVRLTSADFQNRFPLHRGG